MLDSRAMHIGEVIAKRRQRLGLPQTALGFSSAMISMIERGERTPSAQALEAIAGKLGTKPWVLMREASRG